MSLACVPQSLAAERAQWTCCLREGRDIDVNSQRKYAAQGTSYGKENSESVAKKGSMPFVKNLLFHNKSRLLVRFSLSQDRCFGIN